MAQLALRQAAELESHKGNEEAITALKAHHEEMRSSLAFQMSQQAVAGISSNLLTIAQQYKSFAGVYKTVAHGQNMIDTYAGATASYRAMAGIPVFGPALGVAAAAAAVGAGVAKASAINAQKFARGTNFAPGGLSLVGEEGPELVNLPRGSQVVPARKTEDMLGGRQVVSHTQVTAPFTVQIHGSASQDTVRQLDDMSKAHSDRVARAVAQAIDERHPDLLNALRATARF